MLKEKTFRKNFVVEITPAVIFSEHSDKKLESVDKYWGSILC